jgi:hypothetical protein
MGFVYNRDFRLHSIFHRRGSVKDSTSSQHYHVTKQKPKLKPRLPPCAKTLKNNSHTNSTGFFTTIRALLVHAKDADVKRWYERFNFEPSAIEPLCLFLLLKKLNKIINF